MNSNNKFHFFDNQNLYLEIEHLRLYNSYKNTRKLVNQYFDVPRQIGMEEIRENMLSKQEANENNLDPCDILPYGGETYIAAYDMDTNLLVADAVAICSLKDGYSRKTGINIALGRLRDKIQSSSNEDFHFLEETHKVV